MLYHHCRELEGVIFGEVKADSKYSDPDFKKSYLWLEKNVGFYPLFLAVGASEDDIRNTGYQNNWLRLLSYKYEGGKRKGTKYVRKGEFPNFVLFSFENVEGSFMDYMWWHLALNNPDKLTDYQKRLIFKPSWNKRKWLRKARENPGSVQLIAPSLYLPNSKNIYIRNNQTNNLIEKMGFKNVEVRRLALESKRNRKWK